jgi:hypothetical protein
MAQFGTKIRNELLKYLLLKEVDTLDPKTNNMLRDLLVDQLINVLQPEVASHIKIEFCKDPDISWTNILQLTEDYRRTLLPHKKMVAFDQREVREKSRFCSTHGLGNHSTSFCQDKLSTKPQPINRFVKRKADSGNDKTELC